MKNKLSQYDEYLNREILVRSMRNCVSTANAIITALNTLSRNNISVDTGNPGRLLALGWARKGYDLAEQLDMHEYFQRRIHRELYDWVNEDVIING